eukprot:2715189-Amphidinium_carterae.2
MAERCVGLLKTSVRRLLVSGNMSDRFWPYVVHFAAQLQQAKAQGYPWDQPMFGELVATCTLMSKDGQASTKPRGTLQINFFGDGKRWILNQFVWMPTHIACSKIGIFFPSGVKPAHCQRYRLRPSGLSYFLKEKQLG